jgi:hypothetical protein
VKYQSHAVDYGLWLETFENELDHRRKPSREQNPAFLATIEVTRTELFERALQRPPRSPEDVAFIIRLWTDRRAFAGPATPDEMALWAKACGQCKACLAGWSLNAGESLVA